MNVSFIRFVSRLVILCMLALPFQSVQAGMVGTEQMLGAVPAQQDREKVRTFLARADVKQQLEAMGLKAETAKDRVAALTDEEVQKIAGKIDSLPAGASSDWWIVGAVVVIALVVWWVYK